jgi:hypothetical protein
VRDCWFSLGTIIDCTFPFGSDWIGRPAGRRAQPKGRERERVGSGRQLWCNSVERVEKKARNLGKGSKWKGGGAGGGGGRS